MALRNSLFAVSGKASFLDARRDMSGLFVCDKTTMMPIAGILDRSQDNLVTGRGDSMSVTVHPFNAVLNRYGALLIQNDGNVNVPLAAAPSANSRIDVVYVKQHETRSPMSDSSDVPTFGVVEGTAAAVPVAPAVPDGALALAQVLLPAGVSNTAASGVVITQTYIGAAMKGDMLRVQTSAQRDALTEVPEGTLLHNVADNCDYVRKGDKWRGWNMPWCDIHLGANKVHMWASGGTGNIELLSANINLTGWGSKVVVGQVNNTAFYPANSEGVYAPTRDGYFPTIAGVADNGNVYVEYAGGTTGSRIVSPIFTYNIG
jgi:hypothetical protein|nr:MAG TPA: protein of unknown function (DUF4815) [Caudoviricetes sp.]